MYLFRTRIQVCMKEHALHASIVRSFDIKCVEISYICTQHFWNDTSTLQIPPTHLSLMSYLEPFCCALISIFRPQRFHHIYMDIYSCGVISIDT